MASGVPAGVRELWLAGRYTAAISALEAIEPDPERDLFLAQGYLRVGRTADALMLLVSARDAGRFATDESAARCFAFEAVAHAVLGDRRAALAALDQARNIALSFSGSTATEVQYNEAYVFWMLGDLARASEIVGPYVAGAHDEYVEPSLLARFHLLRGWLFAAQERYADQARALLDAIRCLESADVLDVGSLAWSVYPLAALVRDIDVPEALDIVLRLEEQLPWSEDLAMAHFQTVRAVAWAYTLQGEYIRAFRKFTTATALAPNPVARMLVHLDHAHCAMFSDQLLVAQAQLAEADELIQSYDWSTAVWEEARALIQAAELMAPHDAPRAAGYLRQALSLKGRMAPYAGYAHDRRLAALADYADALIRESESDRRVARHRAERAYDVFQAIGYHWRAAQCALFLHRFEADNVWLDRAQAAIAPFQRSFISLGVAQAREGRNPMVELTARQRDILEGLCAGKTIEGISRDLGISPNTVRVHITKIHRTFNVERRSELLREVGRLGIVAA